MGSVSDEPVTYNELLRHIGHEVTFEAFGGKRQEALNFRGDVVWDEEPSEVALVCLSDHAVLIRVARPEADS